VFDTQLVRTSERPPRLAAKHFAQLMRDARELRNATRRASAARTSAQAQTRCCARKGTVNRASCANVSERCEGLLQRVGFDDPARRRLVETQNAISSQQWMTPLAYLTNRAEDVLAVRRALLRESPAYGTNRQTATRCRLCASSKHRRVEREDVIPQQTTSPPFHHIF